MKHPDKISRIKELLASLSHFSDAERAVFYACYLAADGQTKTKIENFLESQKAKLERLDSNLKDKLDSALQQYLNKVLAAGEISQTPTKSADQPDYSPH